MRPYFSRSDRSALTLIELLVCIAIILAIAALAAAFMPRLSDSQRVADAANGMQAWLSQAQATAKRDQLVTGLRIFADDPANPITASKVQLIQQPAPLTGDPAAGTKRLPVGYTDYNAATDTVTVTFSNVDFSNGGLPAGEWLVQPGDSLSLYDGGVHRITGLASGNQLLFANVGDNYNHGLWGGYTPGQFGPWPPPITQWQAANPTASSNYLIIRQPRIMVGEPEMSLPANTVIDLQAMAAHGMVLPSLMPGTYDVSFTPSGAVYTGGVGMYILWLRSIDATPTPGTTAGQSLVCIKLRNGHIFCCDVSPTARPFDLANQQ